MFKVIKKEIKIDSKKITLETGKIARQADGAIIAKCGETVVLATVVGAKKVNPEIDYFPLSVNYQEKYYAAGKIPGGYFKREARPTESETLTSRLIDRPIRPLFPDQFRNEVQLLPTVISYDKENEADILSIIASSAALAISGMPFLGPVGASRVGFIDGKYVLNPSKKELENSKLDLVVAGTKDAVLMVESEANGLTEEEMLNAVKFGHENFVPIIKTIEELAKECRKPEWEVEKKDLSEVKKKMEKEFTKDLEKAFSIKDKKERSDLISEVTEKAKKLYEEDENISELDVNYELKNLEKRIVRTNILKNKSRIDGRGLSDVRPIMCEVGILPRTHGSALFTRGETQAIVVTTLGTSEASKVVSADASGDITLAGASANIKLDKSADDLIFQDDMGAVFGTGNDMRLIHASNQNYISASAQLNVATLNSGVAISIGHTTSEVTVNDNLTVTGDLTVNGTTTSVNSTTIAITSSFTFEGTTPDSNETVLGVVDPTADTTINLPALSAGTYYVPVLAAASTTAISSTPAELNIMDGGSTVNASVAIADTDGIILNDNGTMKQIRASNVKTYAKRQNVQNVDDSGTLQVGFNYWSNLGGAEAATLPASPTVGDIVWIKAPSNCSSTNTVTINKAGSQTIDGETAIKLVSPYAAVSIAYVGSDLWRIY